MLLMKRHIALLIMLLIAALPVAAQWFNVRGTVLENKTLKPMPDASVALTDSTGKIVAGKTTTANGQFMIPGIPAGSYRLKVSFMGYRTQEFDIHLTGRGGNRKVADVLMRENATLMQEAVVEGKVPEMVIVEDTVVYNAAAFTLPPGAMVEELIKKLPGIVIDSDGKITHNGKEVKQILVDGKEFFGNNQQTVLKNIPAEIVDKVKAYEKQSDLARITGIDDGEEKTVLDLEIKKDKRRGWFGRVNAGYGTENRYNAHADVYRFSDKQKAGVVGNANNTRGNGMQETQDAAASLNLEWKRVELNGGLTGRFSQQGGASWSNSQNFENRNAAYSNRRNENGGHSNAFDTQWKVEWKPDSATNIIWRPQFSINGTNNHSSGESATFNDNPYEIAGITSPLEQLASLRSIGVNHNLNASRSSSDQISGNMSLQINRQLGKRGRNITLNLNGSLNKNDGSSSNYSQVDYYQILAATGGDSIYHKIQYDDSYNKGRNGSVRLSYTEPIGSSLYLQGSYQFNYRQQERNRDVSSIFDPQVALNGLSADDYLGHQALAVADIDQCNSTQNTYISHDARLQVRYITTKMRLNAGINLQPQRNSVDYTKGIKHYDVSRSVINWAPTLNFRYRFSREHQIDARYGGQSGQPALTDLIPDTLSNANPLNIRLGNPELKPSFTHTFRAEWRFSQPDYQRSYNFNTDFRATQNATTSRTQYNETTGGRITAPVNINGNWNTNSRFNFNTALRDQRFRINLNTSYNHTVAGGYVYRSDEQATVRNVVTSNAINQSVRGTFRHEFLDETTIEFNLGGGFGYHSSRATATAASNLDTYTFNYGGSAIVNFFFGLSISTDINQNSRRGYSDEAMNTNQWIWNAQASYSFLKRREAQITLRWNDILSQRDMVNRNISATSRTDSDSDRVTSYVMLTFTYRFNIFGSRF